MSDTLIRDAQREWLSLATARIRDTYIRKPCYVDADLDLVAVCRQLQQQGLTTALVRDRRASAERLGIFTTTDLRDALARGGPPAALPVREVARFDLVEIDADAELFEALWLMVRHRVHRLVVRDGDEVLGVLGQLDLLSFVANHSHIAALQIDEATGIDDLRCASARIDAMVALMHDSGIKVERIARLVGELNARLFARLWSLLAPPELVANSCLLVMGSEGRGEQVLKTDQDNALLLRDGFDCAELPALAQRFSDALAELGYPPCPGQVMVTQPLWRQPLAGFRDSLREWTYGHDPQGPMRLAIFIDSRAVAGDAGLLGEARDYLDRILTGSDSFLARFAAAIDSFDAHPRWWQRLLARRDAQPLDLKKLGIFPIVHGVRAMALQQRLHEVGTEARLQALVERGQFDAGLAGQVLEALHFLMTLRLAHQLRQRQAGQRPDHAVRLAELGVLERDALRDALDIVRRLRGVLQQRFMLDIA